MTNYSADIVVKKPVPCTENKTAGNTDSIMTNRSKNNLQNLNGNEHYRSPQTISVYEVSYSFLVGEKRRWIKITPSQKSGKRKESKNCENNFCLSIHIIKKFSSP